MKKLHPKSIWLFFASCFLKLLFIAVLLGVYALSIYAKTNREEIKIENFLDISGLVVMAFVAMLVISYIWARFTYNFYSYDLDSRGFFKESGIIWKKNVSIPYKNIQNVDINRGVLARIFGLADVQIQTAGVSGGKYGSRAEGRLPGLAVTDAMKIRDEILRHVK